MRQQTIDYVLMSRAKREWRRKWWNRYISDRHERIRDISIQSLVMFFLPSFFFSLFIRSTIGSCMLLTQVSRKKRKQCSSFSKCKSCCFVQDATCWILSWKDRQTDCPNDNVMYIFPSCKVKGGGHSGPWPIAQWSKCEKEKKRPDNDIIQIITGFIILNDAHRIRYAIEKRNKIKWQWEKLAARWNIQAALISHLIQRWSDQCWLSQRLHQKRSLFYDKTTNAEQTVPLRRFWNEPVRENRWRWVFTSI